MEALDFARILKHALSKGGEYADIFLEESRSTSVVLEDNNVERAITGIDRGAGVRVIWGEKTAYAFTNEVTEAGLMAVADTIREAVQGDNAGAVMDLTAARPATVMQIVRPPDEVPLREKVTLVQTGNEVARKMDPRVRQVKCIYGDGQRRLTVATSEGRLSTDTRLQTLFLAQVVAEQDGVIQTGYEPVGGVVGFELFDEHPPEEIAEIAVKRAVLMLGARKAPGGPMIVVLSSDAGGTMIHEAIGHGLEADLANQGLSVYAGKVGEQVASPLVTVIDDGTIPNRRGSYSFDDEAEESHKNVLVEHGVLKTYMFDKLSAIRAGRERSTGNGRRESYRFRPIVRMTNTYLDSGDTDPADIVKSVDKGLYVKKMGGGQVNTVNGDFVFEVTEGYLIENGNIAEPVRGATLVGNGPKVLREVDMIGNDLGFGIGTCGKDGQGVPVSDAQPTMRIPEITVGGEISKITTDLTPT